MFRLQFFFYRVDQPTIFYRTNTDNTGKYLSFAIFKKKNDKGLPGLTKLLPLSMKSL